VHAGSSVGRSTAPYPSPLRQDRHLVWDRYAVGTV